MNRELHERCEMLAKIYSIPIEEKWEKYLQDDHFNYVKYMLGLEIIDKQDQDLNTTSNVKIRNNRLFQNYFRKNHSYFEVDSIRNKDVVDVGCGFGFLSFYYALSGARMVHAIGFPYQIEFLSKLFKRAHEKKLLPENAMIDLIPIPLDETSSTIGGLPKESVDFVFFSDVFEHLPDSILKNAIKGSFNVLRKNGKLISITHNTDNKAVLERMKHYWQGLEEATFEKYREGEILKQIPQIPAPALTELVKATRGMLVKEFEAAILQYKSTGTIPVRQKLMPAVDLTYDYICENYISPEYVNRIIHDAGFKSSYYPQLRHSRRFSLFWPFTRLFPSILMKSEALSQAVVFVGTK